MRPRTLLAYSAPTSVLLFCWLTMGVSAAYDSDLITAYGFPLNWYMPSLISSTGYEIATGRLILDFAVYAVLAHLAWIGLTSRVSLKRRASRILIGFLWISAVLSLSFSAVAFSIDPHLTWWNLSPRAPENAQKNHFLSVGLQPRQVTTK